MIVNTKENLPQTIFTVPMAKMKFISPKFLNDITHPSLGNGVKRKGYHVIKVDGMFRPSPFSLSKETQDFIKFLKECDRRNYTLIMIIK